MESLDPLRTYREIAAVLAPKQAWARRPSPATVLGDLRLPEADVKELRRCGLDTVEEVLAYTCSHLADEFGGALLARLVEALREAGFGAPEPGREKWSVLGDSRPSTPTTDSNKAVRESEGANVAMVLPQAARSTTQDTGGPLSWN